MAFLPKNKYQKFYTNGNKFILLKTGKPYTGDYFVTDKGRIFAGKDPQNIIGELKPISSDLPLNINNIPINNRIYSILKQKQTNQQGSYIPIPSTIPPPTIEDYFRGYFRRYIVVRVNDKSYFETNKEVFETFFIKNYNTTLNKIFRINWSLKENNEEDNIKTLRYFETKLPGIFNFFPNKGQYKSKFSSNNIQENQIAKANELFYLDGSPYPEGDKYHIHPDKGPMVGAVHIPEVHALLSFTRFNPDNQDTSSSPSNEGNSGY